MPAAASKPVTAADRQTRKFVGAAVSKSLITAKNAATASSNMTAPIVPETTNWLETPAAVSMINVRERLKPELFYIQI